MANVIRKATNKFTKGLVMDFSPENTKNEVLTHALNATLLTFNGNELSLLNDMGNGRVETAFLPEGYIPVGVCEYGGIIYIVSYNPLEDKSLIGCFPSPERNISQDELGATFNTSLSWEDFLEYKYVKSDTGLYIKSGQNYIIPTLYIDGVIRYDRVPNGDLTQVSQKVLLRNNNLNPGDKFIVYANPGLLDEKLQDLKVNDNPLQHPIIALNVVSIEDSGKIVYLNNDVRKYTVDETEYHILGKNEKDAFGKNTDIDSYRSVLSSGYSVFKEKTSGKLAILAELVMIDSYSVTHKIDSITDLYGNGIDGRFKVTISTDISPHLTNDNYYTAPKLRYYYLKESLGKITGNLSETNEIEMFYNGDFNSSFTSLPITSLIDSNETLEGTLGNSGEFNFPKPNTYHGRLEDFNQSKHNLNEAYALLSPTKFYRIDKDQVLVENSQNVLEYNEAYFGIELGAIIYEYIPEGTRKKFETDDIFNINYIYEIENSKDEYVNVCRDTYYRDNKEILYIQEPNIQLANKEIIDNPNVEKFYQQTLDIYKKILDTDNIPEGTVVWINTSDGYATYQGSLDKSVNYYTKEVVYKMVSGGYTLENTSGNWFYYASSSVYREAKPLEIDNYFNFDTYPKKDEDPYYGCEFILYRKLSVVTITETVEEEEVTKASLEGKDVYYITTYRRVTNPEDYTGVHLLFMTVSKEVLTSPDKFLPDSAKNYILGYSKPDTTDPSVIDNQFPRDDLMILKAFSEFIPKEPQSENITDANALKYTDVKLAEIRIPQIFVDSNLDLPFKYSYTLEPCMNYGKLEHLLVSNTIDFSNLRNFDKSDFTTWKYRIDGNQLMLTFGADVYDTFEADKVSGLFLEFYDWRGFAGSLEISGKRSYSGKFTKILHLDTIGTLSTKKVKMLTETNGEFIEGYNHNVNILEDSNPNNPYGYILNGNPVLYDDELSPDIGWRKVETDVLGNTVYTTLGEDNDCGVLYSNLIYGVKPYLIIQRETDIKIIKKPDLFLLTMPVYNDYYYSVDSFKRLMNPKVNLILTYRLLDDSNIYPYEQSLTTILDKTYPEIKNGYLTNANNEDINVYLNGLFDNETHSLDIKRYFEYNGVTNLQLEVGLLLEYQLFNLSCDPSINERFTCLLQLLNDNGEELPLIKSKNVTSDPCNWDNNIQESNNYFNFIPDNSYFDTDGFINNFSNYNFLENKGSNVIELKYNYIVGYDTHIKNIRKDTVLATSVCALYHKNNGLYNTSDFGIREVTNNNLTIYVSDAIIFNSGSESEQILGLCRVSDINGTTMPDQCLSYKQYFGVVKPINIPGKLNAGNPLKDIVDSIGKLTFCQPHAHGLFASSATSIDTLNDNVNRAVTVTYINLDIIKSPVYNMCINTLNSMNNCSEFISATIRETVYDVNTNYSGFYGLTLKEITKFNRCMLNTMKNVYAYNPDYDAFPVNRGDVTVIDNEIQFTSNILAYNSKFLEGTDFNEYIKIGSIKISDYLIKLHEFSEINIGNISKDGDKISVDWVNEIKFIPDFTYCGLNDDNKYLVSSLTYNIPIPQKLYDDLLLDFSDRIVVKHHDGETWDFIHGQLDKTCLYGWVPDLKKLVSLDITNYKIDQNTGELTVRTDGKANVKEETIDIILGDFSNFNVDPGDDADILMNTNDVLRNKIITRQLSNGDTVDLDITIKIPSHFNDSLGCEVGYNNDRFKYTSSDYRYYDKRFYQDLWYYLILMYTDEKGFNKEMLLTYDLGIKPALDNTTIYISNVDMDLDVRLIHLGSGYFDPNSYDEDYGAAYASLDDLTIDSIKDLPNRTDYRDVDVIRGTGYFNYYDLFSDNRIELIPTYATNIPLYLKTYNYNYDKRDAFFVLWGALSGIEYLDGVTRARWNGDHIKELFNSSMKYYQCSLTLDDNTDLQNSSSKLFVIARYKSPRFKVTVLTYGNLLDTDDDIINVNKVDTYYQFNEKGKYEYLGVLGEDKSQALLVGSNLTLNDLVYYPEIDGHRLFVRKSRYKNITNKEAILYRDAGSNNTNTNLNALRLFSGPCYTKSIKINSDDPENNIPNLNS